MISRYTSALFTRYILIGILVLISMYGCTPGNSRYQEPTEVAIQFAHSLIFKNQDSAFQLSTPTLHKELQMWLSSHKKFRCKTPFWEIDHQRFEIFPKDISPKPSSYEIFYICATDDSVYIFKIDEINLIQTSDGWLVSGWAGICEGNDYSSCY
jgi:hypothetical protein